MSLKYSTKGLRRVEAGHWRMLEPFLDETILLKQGKHWDAYTSFEPNIPVSRQTLDALRKELISRWCAKHPGLYWSPPDHSWGFRSPFGDHLRKVMSAGNSLMWPKTCVINGWEGGMAIRRCGIREVYVYQRYNGTVTHYSPHPGIRAPKHDLPGEAYVDIKPKYKIRVKAKPYETA